MPKARQARAHPGEPAASTRLILCVLPRRLPFNPLLPLLNGYEVAAAATTTEILRLAQKRPCDGYVVHSPLGWLDTAEACRHIRGFDPNTPLIVYTAARSAAEKRDVMAAGAQGYVAHSDDAHNLPGTAGQLIMLAELRSLDAMAAGGEFIREKLVGRLGTLRHGTNGERLITAKSRKRMKLEAQRLFEEAGGSRANYERVWPSLYDRALRQVASASSDAT